MPRKKSRLPRIPRQLELPAGPAPIAREKGLLENEKCAGKFDWRTREIKLDAGLRGSSAWLTLIHERVHIVLADAGVLLPHGLEERVCDAIAQDFVAEMVRLRARS